MQNENQSKLGHTRFPTLDSDSCSCVAFSLVDFCCLRFSNCFRCSFTTLTQTRSQSLLICYLKAMKDWGRNDVIVKIAGYAGKDAQKFGLPLMQCALVKSFPGETRNQSDPQLKTSLFVTRIYFHVLPCLPECALFTLRSLAWVEFAVFAFFKNLVENWF